LRNDSTTSLDWGIGHVSLDALLSTNPLNAFNLSGRIALVTGASKGMGRSIAAILAQAGARVVISSRNQADCDRVAAEISTEPGQCIGIVSDIGDSETLRSLVVTTHATVGKPNILVCNAAGEAPIGPLDKVEAAVFDEAMISNVRNNLLLANLVAPDMVARRDGSIIIMSSIVGGRGRPGMAVYAATKAAVNQLVRTMAVEWGPYQVRTNAIAPTAVRTDFSRALWDTADALARATARVPMGRIGEADDVAGLALLLASPAGSFINGQVIGVDGGASAW
jgi:NAD(P)-dependent dehydrogenase (short-subunit alcohol dehydrogenase family)